MTTIYTGKEIIKQQCRCLLKTATNAQTFRAVFENLAVKELLISMFINIYNYFINQVDLADQL